MTTTTTTTTTTAAALEEAIKAGATTLAGFRRLKASAPAGSEAVAALHEALKEDFKATKRAYPLSLASLQIVAPEAAKLIYHTSRGVAGGFGPTVYRNFERYLKAANGNTSMAEAVKAVKDTFRTMAKSLDLAGATLPILADSTIKALLKEHVKADSKSAMARADVKHFSNELAKALMLKLYGATYRYMSFDTMATAREEANKKSDLAKAKEKAARQAAKAKAKAEEKKAKAEAKAKEKAARTLLKVEVIPSAEVKEA